MHTYKGREHLLLEAVELRKQGYGYRSIARKLSEPVSWSVVRQWVRHIPAPDAHKKSSPFMLHPIPWEELKTNTSRRRALVLERQHRCEMCELGTWLGEPIPLELDHIDGDKGNNSKENSRLLCPNCHALTPTYKGKNMKHLRGAVAQW